MTAANAETMNQPIHLKPLKLAPRSLALIMLLPLALVVIGGAWYATVPTEVTVKPIQSRGAVSPDATAKASADVAHAAQPVKPLTFKEARANADVAAMRAAVEVLAAKGAIAKGMTTEAVIGKLGVPDNTTMQYVDGGFSIGYSALSPTADNYDSFFWLHFKRDAAGAKALAGWWAVDGKK